MWNRQLLLLALALWAACAGAAPLPRIATFPSAAQVYTSEEPGGGLAVLAPNAAVLKAGAAAVGSLLTGLATPEDCAAACRAATSCSWFDFCQTPDGCPQGAQLLAYGDCRLYAQRTCSQPLQLNATQGLLAGFPVLLPEVLVTGFSLVAGQGIAGGDHGCPGSLLPGKCAVRSTEEALLLCLATPACRAVTVLLNGTDGCSSEPVSLLKLEGLSPHNSYVASGVVTLQPPEVRETVNSQLTEAEGQVLLPTAAELAALPATNASLTNDSAWRGCVLGNGTLMAGRPVATLERVDTAEACCRECRAQYAVPNGCNVWNYCPVPGGCSYQGQLMTSNASLGYQQCALLYQELVTPSFGLPPALLAHGPDVPFVGGAPLVVGAEAVLEGYQQLVGRGAVPFGASACDVEQGVVDAVLCVLNVTSVEAMGAWCQDVGACSAFVPWRDSGFANWPQQGVFRRDTSASSRLLMPTQTLYVRDLQPEPQPADSGGDPLSSGAVAGIAVGAAAVGACVAAAIFCVLRKRRRLAAETGKEAEDVEELGGMQASGELDSGTLDARKDSCGDSLLNCPLSDGSAGSQQLPAQQPEQQQQQQQQPLNFPARVGLPSAVAVRPTRHDTVAQRVQQQQQQQQQRGVQMTAPAAHPARAQFATQSVDEDLLSPFAAASVGYGSGTGSPGRAAQQDAPPGGHADGLGQLRAYRLGSPGIAAGGRAGSVPPQSGGRQQWRPPLPPSRSNSGPCSGLPSAAVAAAMARGMDAAAALLAQGSTASTAQSPLQAQASDPRTLTPQGSDSDSARGSGQTAAAAAAGSPGSGIGFASSSSMALLRNQRTGSGALPELAQFVAAQEAAAASGIGGMDETSTHLQLLNEANLPHRLREWVIHPSQVTYQRWANGKLWELGSGASGHVFKATYNGEAVAAKEMEIGQSPAGQEAFLNEALRLQALRHPHVVGFYGVILTGSKGVVLMEYCEGRDLHSALGVTAAGGTHRLFSWHRRGRRVALELVKAINYLHSKGIVHMDIKSSNVLLTSGGTAKLADVAFSRELAGEILPDVPFTGTFPWIAPEVLCGRECTQSVDIFSFGVVLWEIVTGEEPKRGCMRMPQVPEECPQDVCDLMMECLDEVPSVRPTAHQLLQRINQMMERANARGSAARSRASLDRGPASGAPSRMGSQDVASPGLRSEASSELAGARSSRRSMDVLAVRGLSPIPSPTTSPRGR